MTASVVGAAELALVLVTVKQIHGSPCCQPASPKFAITSSRTSETSSSSATESASSTESDADVESKSDEADSAGS